MQTLLKAAPLQKRTPGASFRHPQKFIHSLFQAPSALIVLLLTLILTGTAWYSTRRNIENNARDYFERRVVRTSRAIEERIQTYIDILLSARGLFAVNQNITRVDWKKYTETLQLQARYPGIYSLVFARYVPGSQRAFFEKQVRNDTSLDPKGYPDFSIHPEGERPDYFPIEYTEPFSPIPIQFGFDIGSDPVRRQALEQARDTGQPVSTGRIVLVSLGETGFSVRVPVYRNGLPHSTVEERRRALLGFVAAAFQMEHLMKEILSDNAERDLQFEIFDGGTEKGADPLPLLTKERLLYDSDGILTADTTDEQLGDTQTASLTIAGRIWHLYFSTRSDFGLGAEERLPFLILFGGISFSFLLSYITWSTTTARRRTIDLAETMTADLRESEERFRVIFDQAPSGIGVTDPRGYFIQANERLAEILGYMEEELVGRTFQEMTHPEDLEINLVLRNDLIDGKISKYALQKRYIRKGGGIVWANLTVSPIRDASGKITHTVAIVEDITDQRAAGEKLRKSEAQLAKAQEIAHLGSWELDLTNGAICWSDELYRIYGLAPQSVELTDDLVSGYTHPEDRDRIGQIISTSPRDLQPFDFDYRIVRPDGSVRALHAEGEVLCDQTGKAVRMVGTAQDVTERKQTEDAIVLLQTVTLEISTAEDLQSALEMVLKRVCQATGWILGHAWIPRPDGRALQCSSAWHNAMEGMERFKQYSDAFSFGPNEGLPGQVWTSKKPLWLKDVAAAHHFPRAAVAAEVGIRAGVAIPVLTGEEVVAVIEFFMCEPRQEDEQLVKTISAIAGQLGLVIQRKRAEEALRKSEERFHLATRATNDAVWDWNLVTNTLWWNENLQTLFGYKPEEIEPGIESWTNRLHPEDKERVLSGIHTATEHGEQLWSGEYRFRRGDGSYATILDRGYIVRDAAGAPLRMIGAMMDITERKHAEEALRIKTDQLAAVTDAMTAYLNSRDWHETSSRLLRSALHQTQSEYGFIGAVVEGRLRIITHEGVDWDAVRNRSFYEEALQRYREQGYLDFDRLDNLFGEVIRTGKGVVSNGVAADPRSGGVPPGHPPLHTFLGVPIIREHQVVGMIGVANRPGGYSGAEQNGIEILCHATGILYDSYRRRERETALENQQRNVEKELRRSQEQLRSLSSRLHSMVEEERTRISREIHDELGQLLTILKMELSWLKKRLPKKEALLRDRTKSMAKLVDTTVQTLRKISTELRPGVLDDLGLTAAIEWQVQEFQSRTGMRCHFTVRPEEILLDPDRSTAVFRIFQETLTNIVRHANANEVTILLEKTEDCLILEVNDNGRGITQSQITNSKSLGLLGIRERALLWGGAVQISGVPGRGTTITVQIPLYQPSDIGKKA